jgi:hypothetical protein
MTRKVGLTILLLLFFAQACVTASEDQRAKTKESEKEDAQGDVNGTFSARSPEFPAFVALQDIDPTIIQEIRYATRHNFVGRPIEGYRAGRCMLTKQAAEALAQVQTELKTQ